LRQIARYLGDPHLDLFAGLLDHYFEAYHHLLRIMRLSPPTDGPERQWISSLLKVQGKLRQDESMSKALLQNGLLLLREMGCCDQLSNGDLHWAGVNDLFDKMDRLVSSLIT
jgi:hypothetical protein